MTEAWIIDTPRTPRGKGRSTGSLHSVHPQELVAQLLNATLERNGLVDSDVDDVLVGCVGEYGEQGANIGKLSVLAAGWDVQAAGGASINRFCGSGQSAVDFGAATVMAGLNDIVIGAGVESLSRVPSGSDRGGLHGRNPALNARHPLIPQGVAADLIASAEGFTREAVDRFALSSQQRAARAQAEGRFDRSLVPVADAEGNVLLAADEHPRATTTLEGLGELSPAFVETAGQVAKGDTLSFGEKARSLYPEIKIEHVHHAGNSSGIVDGAGAVLLASPARAKAHGLRPRGRIVSMAVASVEPLMMLTGCAPATRKALAKAGMSTDDVDVFEVNEAFAAVPMKFLRDLDLDPEKLNVNGGAIAFGHPFGATGAMLFGVVLDELERTDKNVGVVSMCIGGGQATATVIERIGG